MVEQIKFLLLGCISMCTSVVVKGQPMVGDSCRRVILISVDGLRPDFYMDSVIWPAPTLQAMARSGVSAPAVQTVFPSVTYPGHTTMVTGVLPGVHGLLGNIDVDSLGQEVGAREYSRIKVPTIWDLARRQGIRTAAVRWPVTIGAPIDYSLCEIEYTNNYTGYKYQPMYEVDQPDGFLEEMEEMAIGKMSNTTYHYLNHSSIDIRTALIAAQVLQQYKPGFMAVHFTLMDDAQHKNGRTGEAVKSALALVDGLILHLVNTLRYAKLLDQTTLVITGDHGFTTYTKIFSPNSWLKQAGLYNSESDWQVKFVITGSSCRLVFNQHRYRFTGAEQARLIAKVKQQVQRLPDSVRNQVLVHSGASIPGLMNKEENYLLLSAKSGSYFDKDVNNAGSKPALGGGHGASSIDPQLNTGLIAWGAQINAPAKTDQLILTDVFPLLKLLLIDDKQQSPVWSKYLKK